MWIVFFICIHKNNQIEKEIEAELMCSSRNDVLHLSDRRRCQLQHFSSLLRTVCDEDASPGLCVCVCEGGGSVCVCV